MYTMAHLMRSLLCPDLPETSSTIAITSDHMSGNYVAKKLLNYLGCGTFRDFQIYS